MNKLIESFLKLNKDIILSEELIREFNSMQKQQILITYGDNFTIAYEFELDLNPNVNGDDLVKSHINDDIFNINLSEKDILGAFSFVNFNNQEIINLINSFPDALNQINKFMFKSISNKDIVADDTPVIQMISSVENFVNRQLMKLDTPYKINKVLIQIFKEDVKKYINEIYIPSVINAIKKDFHITIFTSPLSFLRSLGKDFILPNTALVGVIASAIKENIRHNLFQSLFPNFYKKYVNNITIKPDATLTHFGIEVVNNPYLDSIAKGFEYIDDFYNDMNNQTVLIFNKSTGIHVNIGYKNDNSFNIIKGFLLNNEYDKDGNVGGMAFKGLDSRKENGNTQPYDKRFMMYAKEAIKIAQENGKLPKFTKESLNVYEKILNQSLIVSAAQLEKAIGFNIGKIYNKYIEFRYPGGNVSPETLKEQTIFYANLVLACKDPEYRKDDYIKKLNKLVIDILSNINSEPIHKNINSNPQDIQVKADAVQQSNKVAGNL